jgi:glucose-6-phosphate isomerase
MISLDAAHLKSFITEKEVKDLFPQIKTAHEKLENGTGKGNAFTGWKDLPSKIEDSFINELVKLGKEVRKKSDCIVCVGIGGSYLGIRATIEFLRGQAKIPVYYAGQNIGVDYHYQLLETLKNKKPTVIVLSKSGTTTEPAIAFRILKKLLEKKYSAKEVKNRIICVTDKEKGALRKIADREGYRTYVIPDDVGGRYSVLTPVGLVPLAIAGIDIKSLVEGARAGQKEYSVPDCSKNNAYHYAAYRYLLYKKGKKIEVLSSFYDNVYYVAEFWKQLYGESEGKDGKGIFPSSLILSTDLHSMGQLMQEGERNLFETFISLDKQMHKIVIPKDKHNLDDFNIIAGQDLDYLNKQAYKGTAQAHYEGGVPNMTLTLCQADAFHLGQLYYFFMRAVAISGYLLDVNPFNQPGVEAYKKKMFALLGKK